jgi:predicted permease
MEADMDFVLKIAALILILLGGVFLRRKGFFEEGDYRVISRIVVNMTLPAAVVHAFSDFEKSGEMLFVVLAGIVFSSLPGMISLLFTKRKDKGVRAFFALGASGYSIGSFAMPLIQTFYESSSAIVCMFDIGNAVVVTGGAYALTSAVLQTGTEGRETPGSILKKLCSSVPFDTYVLMFLLVCLNVRVSDVVLKLTAPVAAANKFLAMLMIGMMIKPVSFRSGLKEVIWLVIYRALLGILFAVVIFFAAPFSLEIRKILTVLVFAPISIFAPVYTEKAGGDGGLAGVASSVSVFTGLVFMLVVMFLETLLAGQ